MPDERFEALLPEMELLIGQSDMPKARLDRAPKLRAIVNVETGSCRTSITRRARARRSRAGAEVGLRAAVAEMALGMAIDLCRGVSAADRAMRAGSEKWVLDDAAGCFSLYGAPVGPDRLRRPGARLDAAAGPSAARSRLTTPGFPIIDRLLRRLAAPLDEVLSTSRVIVVFAAVTSENQGFLAGANSN